LEKVSEILGQYKFKLKATLNGDHLFVKIS